MPIIMVERANFTTMQFESALINTDAISWVEELHLPNVPAALGSWACDVWLTSGRLISIHSSIEELLETIYWASHHDAKPKSMEGPAWAWGKHKA